MFSVYPNPNKGAFTIELKTQLSRDAQVEIINAMGQVVFEEAIENSKKNRIELSDPNPGIYMLRILSGADSHVHRIVIR